MLKVFTMRPTIKKLLVCCAPTYPPKLALPKKIYGHFGEDIFFIQKSKTRIQFPKIIFFPKPKCFIQVYHIVKASVYPILNHMICIC